MDLLERLKAVRYTAEGETIVQASRITPELTAILKKLDTRESWSRERRVIAKAEHLPKGSNPRFVVTSLPADEVDARTLYEEVYCARGQVENPGPR